MLHYYYDKNKLHTSKQKETITDNVLGHSICQINREGEKHILKKTFLHSYRNPSLLTDATSASYVFFQLQFQQVICIQFHYEEFKDTIRITISTYLGKSDFIGHVPDK